MPEQEKALDWLLSQNILAKGRVSQGHGARYRDLSPDGYGDPDPVIQSIANSYAGYNPRTQWKQQDGTVINLADMEDSHLKAARDMLVGIETRLEGRLAHTRSGMANLAREMDRRRKAAIEEEKKIQAAAKKAADDAYQAAYAAEKARLSSPAKPLAEGRKFRV